MCSSLFGGGGGGAMPTPPPPPVIAKAPTYADASKGIRATDASRRRGVGRAQTMLTKALSSSDDASTSKKTLLGS